MHPDVPDPNPSGLCMCGCGQPTAIITVNRYGKNERKGHHRRYTVGHARRTHHPVNPNPSGLCQCGCGQPTPIAKVTEYRTHSVAGFPLRWVWGHWGCLAPVEYIEQDCGYETPCWVWQRAFDKRGYGQIRVDGRLRRAPRVYWERENGPVPEGMHLDHLCRNRACVNPSHTEPVTQTENIRRGAATKLTVDAVTEIKFRLREGQTQAAIAADFGVSEYTIGDIYRGRTWKDVA